MDKLVVVLVQPEEEVAEVSRDIEEVFCACDFSQTKTIQIKNDIQMTTS
jgi:hypothetical protein